MNEAQAEFDRHLQPGLPLPADRAGAAPGSWPTSRSSRYVLGGKGVGSQGDGTAQFLVRDEEAQGRVIEIVERDLGMSCLKLVVQAGQARAQGRHPGGRLRHPPVPGHQGDQEGAVPGHRPRRARQAGHPGHRRGGPERGHRGGGDRRAGRGPREVSRSIFGTPPRDRALQQALPGGPGVLRATSLDIGRRITLLAQERQEGFGHAVLLRARVGRRRAVPAAAGRPPLRLRDGNRLLQPAASRRLRPGRPQRRRPAGHAAASRCTTSAA